MNNISDILENMKDEFGRRKFVAGLLVAFIDFLEDLGVEGGEFASLDSFFEAFPRREKTSSGGTANTLIVERGGDRTLSIRPFYNAVEKFLRSEEKRFDFPSCAPHATQAWQDYLQWLEILVGATVAQRAILRSDVLRFVLAELPSHEFDPANARVDPPVFELLLSDFDFSSKKGEKSGAAFQGAVFGFLRADNPHLQVEIEKVRTGSKRLQRVGDIDCWDGGSLALTCEVKDFHVTKKCAEELLAFAGEGINRGAITVVAAASFEPEARAFLEAEGASCLDVEDMLKISHLWDPAKQRVAISALVYYATHVEKNSALTARIGGFLSKFKK